MTEAEALRRFFLFTYHEARISLDYHHARAQGGQVVGVPRLSISEASRVAREARQLGLGIEYDATGMDRVTFTDPDGPGNAPALAGS